MNYRDVCAVLLKAKNVDRAAIDRPMRLRIIARHHVGNENVDIDAVA